MDRLLRVLRIGRKEARYIAICSLGFLLVLAWQGWSFKHSPVGLTTPDILFFTGASVLAAVIMLASGWLGFTSGGRRYSEQLFKSEINEVTIVHVSKVVFAVGALAFAVLISLFVVLLLIGGTDLVLIFFNGKILGVAYGALILVCLPIVLKYLK